MNSWLIAAAYTMCGTLMAIMLMGIVFSVFMPALSRWNRGYFITFFSFLFLYIVVIFIDVILYADTDMAKAGKAVVLIEYLFFSVLTLMPIPFLLHCCGENIKRSALLRAGIALWGGFWLLLLIGQFTDAFYYIAPDQQYARGAWFPLLMAPLAVILLITIAGLLKRRKTLTKKVLTALLVYLLPTAVLIILYMFASVDVLLSLWLVLCAQTMFGLILTDSVEQHMRQQREIARQQQEIAHERASVMVLRMRPHFIYNTLMSIYYLCKQDTEKAQQVILDFSSYLRQNFTAIAKEDTIPFTEELEHTRAYLAVEQARFQDRLLVKFETPFTTFRIPPLTLQPIVENAVKHGLDPELEPLFISVYSRQRDGYAEIIVEDSGPGYKPSDDDEPHIALANISKRLKMMCGGELTISNADCGGTIVAIRIPVRCET